MKEQIEPHSLVFRFGDVEVCEAEYTITKGGAALQVEPKAFKVLLYLLHNPGRLISKDELLDAVWNDCEVSENSLTRNIAYLRRLLGDDHHEPRYIATVTTAGYRFICPVEVSEYTNGGLTTTNTVGAGNGNGTVTQLPGAMEAAADQQAENEHDAVSRVNLPQGKSSASRRRWILATVVMMICLGAAGWFLLRPRPTLRVTEFAQITHDGNMKVLVGTDGIRLYFNQEFSLWPTNEISISGGDISRVPLPLKNYWLQDVSPDGSEILIGSCGCGPNRPGLWSYQVPGGTLRELDTDTSVISSAWSPDAKTVVYSSWEGDIRVVRSDGADTHKVVAAKDPYHEQATSLSWSPDGRTIRFVRENKIWEMLPDGTGVHALLPDWKPSFKQYDGRWTPDGRFFLFLAGDTNTGSQIWVRDERRGLFKKAASEPAQLTSGPISYSTLIPSKDGKTVFARGIVPRGEVVRYDSSSRQLQPYLGGISAEYLSFSPDGQFVLFVTFPEGILWKANRDGSNPVRMTDPPLYPMEPHWSPDGTQILYLAADAKGYSTLYLLSAQGGAPRPILPEDHEDMGSFSWSPDGRKITFDGLEVEPGGTSKAVVRILTLGNHQLETLPGSEWLPNWSPDGRYIVAEEASTRYLTVYDFRTKQWSILLKARADWPTWSRDSQFIYFQQLFADPGIYRIRPTGGKVETISDLKNFRTTGHYLSWMGLDPDDAPILLRNAGTDEIFALKLDEK